MVVPNTESTNIDEIQYVKDMYELRDYVLFSANEDDKKEICILSNKKNISYGIKINGIYHEKKMISAKETSLNTISNLLIREYNDYYSVTKDMGNDTISVEANILIIGNAMITMADLTNIKSKFSDDDLLFKTILEQITKTFRL